MGILCPDYKFDYLKFQVAEIELAVFSFKIFQYAHTSFKSAAPWGHQTRRKIEACPGPTVVGSPECTLGRY
jgi:hypothetical protein